MSDKLNINIAKGQTWLARVFTLSEYCLVILYIIFKNNYYKN